MSEENKNRCPNCNKGKLNKFYIQKKRKWKGFTPLICFDYKIIIDNDHEFKYFDGTSIVS